jgi:lipopolysaccharide export system permease protein
MKILDRYILAEFLKKWISILTLFALILLLKNLLGDMTDLLKDKPQPVQVVLFFAYSLPLDLIEVVPISVILAMMFSIGAMAKRKEILAMHACGVSYTRLAVPLAVIVALLTLGVFYCNEKVLPECSFQSRYIEKVEIKKISPSTLSRRKNITTKGKGDRFYTMKSFNSETNRMEQPTITDLFTSPVGGRTIQLRIDAESAELIEQKEEPAAADNKGSSSGKGAPRLWRFYDATVIEFDAQGKLLERRQADVIDIPMEEELNRFLATNVREKEMNFSELREFARVQGERSKGEYYRRLRTEMFAKLAFPLAVFLLGMLGYTFAVRSSIRSLVYEFGMAILCVVLWYTCFGSAPRLGREGFVPPFVAAWYGNILFTALLVWRFRQLERIPTR